MKDQNKSKIIVFQKNTVLPNMFNFFYPNMVTSIVSLSANFFKKINCPSNNQLLTAIKVIFTSMLYVIWLAGSLYLSR
jgi:hypothetical protein